jgi:acetyl-CoA carboxylase biotin carboxyl carrier protein
MSKRKDAQHGKDVPKDSQKIAYKESRKDVAPAAAKAVGTASGLDLDAVRELARIAGEYGLTEIEAEPSGRIRISRRAAGAGAEVAAMAGPAAAPIALAPALAPVSPLEAVAAPGTFITSPFVGTFYSAPSPEAAPFVAVGDPVRKGQVVCIVEAMKLMNEIEAEADGKVAEVLAKNGEHVEYGQALMRLTIR